MQLVTFSTRLALQLQALFEGERPIPIRLWAILDGTIAGRILVDDAEQPRLALVQELAEGTTYLGGALTASAIADGIQMLRAYQEVVICVWPEDPLSGLLPTHPDYEGIAIDFTGRSPAVHLGQLAHPPAGYRLRRIDEAILPSLQGFDYYVSMFGGIEPALRNTLGYCLLSSDTVVSEAVAGPFSRGLAELGVGTGEAYRRQGLATVTSARLIQECEKTGYQVFWNAAQQNVASVALARRLGFQTEKPFRVLAWSAST